MLRQTCQMLDTSKPHRRAGRGRVPGSWRVNLNSFKMTDFKDVKPYTLQRAPGRRRRTARSCA